MELSLGAVIVTVPTHLRFLPGLVDNLNRCAPEFQQIVVVASGFRSPRTIRRILASLQSRDVSLVLVPLGSAGKNRNIGWTHIKTDFVCFLDSDDLYAPGRNKIINAIYEENPFDLFLHAYEEFSDAERLPMLPSDAAGFDASKLVRGASLIRRIPRQRSLELQGLTESTNILFAKPHQEFPVHHAHSTIRTCLRDTFRFHEVFGVRNEDGVLAQDILDADFDVVLSPQILSSYRQGARAKPRKTPLLKVAEKLRSAFGRPNAGRYIRIR